jgi:hypothetical protein
MSLTKVPNDMLATPGAGGGAVAQIKYAETGGMWQGTTVLPFDDTVPQNTEGDQILTATITPTSATNYLEVEAVLQVSAAAAMYLSAALFRDSTTGAFSAAALYSGSTEYQYPKQLVVKGRVLAGSTSATTFKVRGGGSSTGGFRLNTTYAGAHLFNGVSVSSLTVREVAP